MTENGNEFRLLCYNGVNPEIGGNKGTIEFWYSSPVGYNSLKAKEYIKMSDRELKDNIKPLIGGLQTVLNLQGVTYTYKDTREVTNGTPP